MLDLAAPCNDPTLGPQPQPQPQPCRRRTGLAPAACAVTCLILGATAYLVATPSPRHSTAWAQAPAAVQQPTAAQPPSLRQRPPALHRASPAASQRQAPAVLRSVVWRRGDSAALPHGEGPPIPGHVPRIWAAVCAVLAAGYLCVRRLRHRRQWAVLANTGRETPLTPFARPRAAPMYASIVESPAPKRRRPRDGGTPDSAPDAAGAAPGVAAVVPAAMPEVLAPAGGWDALKAAVSAGADAVYFGSDAFNARARAENFSQAELPEVMAYLHERNVRGYMTFNVLVFPTELAAAADLLRAAEAAGVDAVIVQDVGLACLARHVAPNLRLHGSTQMSITSVAGVSQAADLGCDTAVLARELSLKDMARIRSQMDHRGLDTKLEVFVHGALCVAFSGQCLTSESLGQRSANRGECAQACRLPYGLVVDDELKDLQDARYLLSPQDFFAWERIPELVAAGVDSFKIEGRLKSPSYVAATTDAYRKGLDRLRALPTPTPPSFEETRAVRHDLGLAFSRGLHTGWLDGIDNQKLVHGKWSKKRGPYVGQLSGKPERGWLYVATTEPLKAGDGLVLEVSGSGPFDLPREVGGRVMSVRPSGLRGVQQVRLGPGRIDLRGLKRGSPCWLTSDMALESKWQKLSRRAAPVTAARLDLRVRARPGEPLAVTCVAEGHGSVTLQTPEIAEPATGRPLTAETLRDQFGRLGGTGWELGTLEADLQGDLFVPVSALNRLRRRLVDELAQGSAAPPPTGRDAAAPALNAVPLAHWPAARTDLPGLLREAATVWAPAAPAPTTPHLHVLARSLPQLRALLPLGRRGLVQRVYLDMDQPTELKEAARAGRGAFSGGCYVTGARITRPNEQWSLAPLLRADAEGYLVRNADHLERLTATGKPCVGDFSLNVANPLTAAWYRQRWGLEGVTASYDLAAEQLVELLGALPVGSVEVTLHQHMPMFHMEHCVFCRFLSDGTDFKDCGRPCEKHKVELLDRSGAKHPLVADLGCRNTLYNGTAQTGAQFFGMLRGAGCKHFRLELLREDADETEALVQAYRALLDGDRSGDDLWKDLQVSSQLGVTRGTLQEHPKH